MTSGMIDVIRHGKIALVTLKRPPANAMNIELTEEIASVFQDFGQDDEVRSVVLTGALIFSKTYGLVAYSKPCPVEVSDG
jgi:enoyl-CoA hydratase/carnithine racemase